MKIIYKNYGGGEYHTFWSPINGCRPKRIIGFRQKQPNEFVEIPIYDSESDALPIYTELITLDTIDFAEKYGVLVSPSLVPTYDVDTHNYLLSEPLKQVVDMIEFKTYYECMFFDVYSYYKFLMERLITINQLLKRLSKNSISIIRLLSEECYRIVTPPSYDAVLGTQYVYPDDDKYNEYFKVNPYAHIVYMVDQAITSHSFEWKFNFSSCFADPEMGRIFNKIFILYYYHGDITDSFLEKNQKQIVDLAKFLFSNALSNEIKDIYPIVNYDQSVLLNEWYFPTLASALFYSFYLDYSSSLMIARCANKYCNKIYSYRKTRKTRKYCCPECAHNVADRRYMRKRAKQQSGNS